MEESRAELEPWEYPDEDDEFDELELETCPDCGALYDDEAERCPHCGHWMLPDRSIGSGWKMVAIVLLILFGLACLRLL